MCERACPNCKSEDHFEQYGITGTTITCEGCGMILASRRDPDAALTSMSEEEARTWWVEGTFVTPGAEAKDPDDDVIFTAIMEKSQ